MDLDTKTTTLKPFAKLGDFDPRMNGLALVEIQFSICAKDGEGGETGGSWTVIKRPHDSEYGHFINGKPETPFTIAVLERGYEQTIKDCSELYLGGHVKIRLLDQAHKSVTYRTDKPTRIQLLNAFKLAKTVRKVTLGGVRG